MTDNVEDFLREKVRQLLDRKANASFGSLEYEKAEKELHSLVVMTDLKALEYIEELDETLH